MKMVTVGPIGCSAVGEAAKGLGEKFNDLRLGVVFLPHDADCDASIKAIKVALPNVPVVGCTSGSYAFTQRGGTTNGACMGFIRGNDIHVELGKIERYSGDIKEDAKKAIDAMKPFESKRHTLLTFTDYYGFDGSAFGDALDEILPGDWCVLGGLAGDGMLMSGDAKVFCNDKVIKRGAVMARIDCDSQPGMVARHGFEITEPDEQFSVTECKGNVIYGLNGMPAVDAYCDALKRIGVLNGFHSLSRADQLGTPIGLHQRVWRRPGHSHAAHDQRQGFGHGRVFPSGQDGAHMPLEPQIHDRDPGRGLEAVLEVVALESGGTVPLGHRLRGEALHIGQGVPRPGRQLQAHKRHAHAGLCVLRRDHALGAVIELLPQLHGGLLRLVKAQCAEKKGTRKKNRGRGARFGRNAG